MTDFTAAELRVVLDLGIRLKSVPRSKQATLLAGRYACLPPTPCPVWLVKLVPLSAQVPTGQRHSTWKLARSAVFRVWFGTSRADSLPFGPELVEISSAHIHVTDLTTTCRPLFWAAERWG